MALEPRFARTLMSIVGRDHVSVAPAIATRFSCCSTSFLRATPDAVLFAACTGDVSELLSKAAAWGAAAVQRYAARQMTSGLALRSGGIVRALGRMNQILDQHLSAYPQSDADGAHFGAERRDVGSCRVIGLEVVSPTGPIARMGGDRLAAPVGEQAFPRLLAGPDGTFAVIIELTLALDQPQPFYSCSRAITRAGPAARPCAGSARSTTGSDATHTAVAANAAWYGELFRDLRDGRVARARQAGASVLTEAPTSVRIGPSALVARVSEYSTADGPGGEA